MLLAVTDNQEASVLPTTLVSWEIAGDILAVSVPEPATFCLLTVGLLLMAGDRTRRRSSLYCWRDNLKGTFIYDIASIDRACAISRGPIGRT